MDPAIEDGARRQSELEAAKAAFLLSGKVIQKIPIGQGCGNKTGLTRTETFAQRKGSKVGRSNHSAELKRRRALLEQSIRYCAEQQGLNRVDTAEAVGCKVSMVSTIEKEFGIKFKCAG